MVGQTGPPAVTAADRADGIAVTVVKTAEIAMPRGYVFRAQGSPISRLRAGLSTGQDALLGPCLAFVLDHPAAGPILVDTGFHRDARTHLRRDFGLPMSLLFRGLRPAREPFDDQLRELQREPQEIRSVIMTHLHVDHTSAMRLLPNARFVISRAEWQATRGRFPAAGGYTPHHLPAEDRIDLVDPERDGEQFGPFHKALDLLGDGTIRLLSTPGHSRGHMSVLVRLPNGRSALLAGDAAYTLRNIREELLPMLTVDDKASRRSLRELKAFMDDDPGAIVVPTHDPDAWRALDELSTAARASLSPGA
jgi:N-acyl homoserine lactone hydrolase